MKKIISLFKRNYDGDRLIRNETVEGSEWVIAGEGWATEKVDGTACLVRDGKLYKRHDAKKGKKPPEGFIPAQPEANPETGHWPGWVEVSKSKPEDKWHVEAWKNAEAPMPEATYELVGPRVQSNPYKLGKHQLVQHGEHVLEGVPRNFDELRTYFFERVHIEGIVWWHPDGRTVKVKTRDFGLRTQYTDSYLYCKETEARKEIEHEKADTEKA